MTRKNAPGDEDETVGTQLLARRLALAPTSVARLASDGVLARAGRGRYHLWPSVLGYVGHLRKVATGRGSPTSEARKRLLEAQAARAEFRLQQERGEWLRRSEVMAEQVAINRRIRDQLLALPTRVGADCGLDRVAISAVDEEVRQILTELADPTRYTDEVPVPP